MAAADKNRSITGPQSAGFDLPRRYDVAAAASVHVYAGTLVARDMGTTGRPARPAAANLNYLVHGFADIEVDNSSGAQGAKKVGITVQPGWLANSATTDAITDAHIGRPCFVVNDQTVALTDGGGTRPVAGEILAVDSVYGVLVLPMAGVNRRQQVLIKDPGNAGAIPVDRSGTCNLVSAGAETRTLAIPSFVGQELVLGMDTDGGDIVITSAQAINAAGNTTITMNDAGDIVVLKAISIAGAARWRVALNTTATLG